MKSTIKTSLFLSSAAIALAGPLAAASHGSGTTPKGSYMPATAPHQSAPSSSLRKLTGPPGKGPVIDRVPFRSEKPAVKAPHTLLKRFGPLGKGPVRGTR